MKRIDWSPEARADVRAIQKLTAMRIIRAIDRYARTGTGDVKQLQPPYDELRLRAGDWRVFFSGAETGAMYITRVLNRKQAYRR